MTLVLPTNGQEAAIWQAALTANIAATPDPLVVQQGDLQQAMWNVYNCITFGSLPGTWISSLYILTDWGRAGQPTANAIPKPYFPARHLGYPGMYAHSYLLYLQNLAKAFTKWRRWETVTHDLEGIVYCGAVLHVISQIPLNLPYSRYNQQYFECPLSRSAA